MLLLEPGSDAPRYYMAGSDDDDDDGAMALLRGYTDNVDVEMIYTFATPP